jgi:hypothetical protein
MEIIGAIFFILICIAAVKSGMDRAKSRHETHELYLEMQKEKESIG